MYFRSIILILILSIICQSALAEGLLIDRRKIQVDDEISYFFYPLVYQVPGLGSGEGAGGTIVNILGDGSTTSLLHIQGDIEVDSIVLRDIPLFTPHFTLSAAYAEGRKGGFAFYGRGPDSPEEPEFTLEFGKSWGGALDLGLNFFDKQLEFYWGMAFALPEIDYDRSNIASFDTLDTMTPEEQEDELAAFMKNLLKYYNLTRLIVGRKGIRLDLTDDRIDPRVGVRFHYEEYGFEGDGLTNYKVDDYSLTAYIPIDDKSSVLVANIFYSSSEVMKALGDEKFWDYETCLEEISKDRPQEEVDVVSNETLCRGLVRGVDDFNETEADNSNATSLGGPNRLRSFPISRFYDKYSFFAGLEYRMYFVEHTTPFNFILEKGVFEALQLALFYEIGQVSPTNDSALYSDFKYSTGVGLRMVFSSVVLRADYATGKEGNEVTVFIGYGF